MELVITEYSKGHRVGEGCIWRGRNIGIVRSRIRGKERAKECGFISMRSTIKLVVRMGKRGKGGFTVVNDILSSEPEISTSRSRREAII